MATIGLCMIVRNEAHIIRRCLDSVALLVDRVLIVDTGSTDGTQEAVRDFLAERCIAGAVVEQPWRDFAWNRSQALALLRDDETIDYGLMIDADEVLVYDDGFDPAAFKAGLDRDFYAIPTRHGDIINLRPQLFSNRRAFRFKGVVHEFLEAPANAVSRGIVDGFHNRPIQDSARNRNPGKFLDDAAALDAARQDESDPVMIARYTFYLAQSYRDGERPGLALAAYLERAGQGGWDQEIYQSLLNAARLHEALGHGEGDILGCYFQAFELCPTRAEALHGALRYCRSNGKPQLGLLLGRHALTLACPADGLFVQPWIYQHGLLDELSVAAYWAGQYQESLDACHRLLAEGRIPQEEHDRVRRNAQFAVDRLQP